MLGLVAIWRLTLAWWVETTLLSAPLLTPKVGFAAMLIGDKGCVAGGGIEAGTKAQLLEPPTCRDPHQSGDAGEGWGEPGEPSKASRLFQGQHHLNGLLLQLVRGVAQMSQLLSLGWSPDAFRMVLWGPGACRGNHSRESRILENT